MPTTHPRYSAEVRAEAIRLVRSSGKTAIARDLGIALEAFRAGVRSAPPREARADRSLPAT